VSGIFAYKRVRTGAWRDPVMPHEPQELRWQTVGDTTIRLRAAGKSRLL